MTQKITYERDTCGKPILPVRPPFDGKPDMTAFEQGWFDAERGVSLRDCPYMRGTGSAIAWRNGWKACYAAHDDNG